MTHDTCDIVQKQKKDLYPLLETMGKKEYGGMKLKLGISSRESKINLFWEVNLNKYFVFFANIVFTETKKRFVLLCAKRWWGTNAETHLPTACAICG